MDYLFKLSFSNSCSIYLYRPTFENNQNSYYVTSTYSYVDVFDTNRSLSVKSSAVTYLEDFDFDSCFLEI